MNESDRSSESSVSDVFFRIFRDQRVAFLIVGAINTVVGFAVFIACSQTVGRLVDHRCSILLGTLVTILVAHPVNVCFAFMMHRRFVFHVRGHVLLDLMRFGSVYLTGFGINLVALPVLMAGFDMHRVPAQAILLVFGTVGSYLGHRYFSFRRGATDAHDATQRPASG